jgi:endonuclease-3 related protein
LKNDLLGKFYDALFERFGPQGWWPAKTRFEVIVGAILTQNTAWTNVEKAIRNLKGRGALSPEKLRALPAEKLAKLIRPAGYFNVKARRLGHFIDHLHKRHGGSLERLFKTPTAKLRDELLSINGIGPETADSILLYAAKRPVFVVDAYTKRILSRHGLCAPDDDYHAVQALFAGNMKADERAFNEYHALIVRTGKELCRKTKPDCKACPLERYLS